MTRYGHMDECGIGTDCQWTTKKMTERKRINENQKEWQNEWTKTGLNYWNAEWMDGWMKGSE